MVNRIGRKVFGPYMDRGWRVGTVVKQHDGYVEWQVPGESQTRLMLNYVADEREVTPRDSFDRMPGDRDA